VTPKKVVFLGGFGLADCTPGREPRSVAASMCWYRCVAMTRYAVSAECVASANTLRSGVVEMFTGGSGEWTEFAAGRRVLQQLANVDETRAVLQGK